MGGFYWHHQRELLEGYKDAFFASIRKVFRTKTNEWSSAYFHAMFPHDPGTRERYTHTNEYAALSSLIYPPFPPSSSHLLEDPKVLSQAEALLATLDSATESRLIRSLKEAIDDLKRAKKCRDLCLVSA